ncbi:MAG: hypothetical protein V3R87_13250 [Dehalococcoidia bacterium]
MKLSIKRIYCASCSRLVKGQEQIEKEDVAKIHILCSRCGKLLYVGNGATWKGVREGN